MKYKKKTKLIFLGFTLCRSKTARAWGTIIQYVASPQLFPLWRPRLLECDVILCTVHVVRLWMKKIYHPQTRNLMVFAMHKRTKVGCETLVQEAIDACPLATIRQYISRNYQRNTKQWALWARQHAPLLLQVTSTNALESYHSELKRMTSPTFGLIGKSIYG